MMDDDTAYLNLFLDEPALTLNCLQINFKYVDERRAFQNISENNKLVNLISTINTTLHTSGKDRSKALLLLETLLTQCSADLFTEYSDGWMQQCLRWNQNTVDDELRVLRELIEKSVSIPGAKQHIITNILRQFAERLTSVENIQKSAPTVINLLRCLKSFIHCYSSSCGSHRGTFQKYVTYCLTEHRKNEHIVHEAAACFVALCECGSKGQQGIHFKDAWSSKFNLLINTCHKLLDSMYSNVNVVGLVAVEQVKEFLPELADMTTNADDTPIKRYHLMMERLFVVAELLRAMLLCKYSALKSFRPDVVLNLTNRVLSVTGSVLQKCTQTNDILILTAIVPELHEKIIEIIKALIKTAKRNLIPSSSLICELCLQSLKWTNSSEWAYGSRKPFESLRCKVYSLLSLWMSVVGSSSCIEIFADELIPIIVADIEFVKPTVKLTVTTKPSKTGKSRKRGRMVTEMNMLSDSSILIDRKANADVCVAAHRALQSLLRCASVSIKWEHHKYLQSVILPLLSETFNSLSSMSYPLPYSDSRCRQCLFNSLLSLVQDPHPKWTAPLSLANRFLSIGMHDENVEVASFCQMAVCQIELLIHPRCPTMCFSYDTAEKSSNSEVGVSVSEEIDSAMPVEKSSGRIEKTRPLRSTNVSETDIRVIKRVHWDENVSVHTPSTSSSVEPVEAPLKSSATSVKPVHQQPDSNVTKIQEGTSPTANTSTSSSNETRELIKVPSETEEVARESIEVPEISEPRAKKSKISPVREIDDQEGDEKFKSMLNDFVESWK